MIHAVLALGLLGLYFPSAFSQLEMPSDSICPVLEAKKDFDKHRFQGQWLAQGLWTDSLGLECLILNFKFKDENHVEIMNRGTDLTSGELKIIFMDAYIPDSTDPASWKLSEVARGEPGDYLILDTDYFDYAVVYWCTELSDERISSALLLSKTPFPDERRIDEALESVSRLGLNKTDLVWMDRYEANCDDKLNQWAHMQHYFREFHME